MIALDNSMLFCLQESYDNPLPKPSQAQVKGVCTGCISSCDCGVNQYCGVGDISIAKAISSNGGTAGPATFSDHPLFVQCYSVPFVYGYSICSLPGSPAESILKMSNKFRASVGD